MNIPQSLQEVAEARIAKDKANIDQSLMCIREKRPLDAEPDATRKLDRIQVLTQTDRQTATLIADHVPPTKLGLSNPAQVSRAESIQGATVDYLGVAWLDEGAKARNAVGRITFSNGSPSGTGFLISDRLIITNNHVINSPDAARGMRFELKYEIEIGQSAPQPIQFELEPDVFFATSPVKDLDYTVVALGRCLSENVHLQDFGCCPLSKSPAKHMVGECVNIVQHHNGDYKQVVVRENRIVNRGDVVLHYITDTEPGSSGSPVFNDDWQVVALHHYGGPYLQKVDDTGQPLDMAMNEGIRISKIVEDLESQLPRMSADQRALVQQALRAVDPVDIGTRTLGVPPSEESVVPAVPSAPSPTAPMPATESQPTDSRAIDPDYSDRRGYDPDFLPGFHVPMPQLSVDQLRHAARAAGSPASNPYELRYHHFSVVMNAERRLPFFSVSNIDGAHHMHLDRKTGRVSAPESLAEAVRSGEVWTTDPRISTDAQLSDDFYARLRKDTRAAIEIRGKSVDEFFARGHMTRREDPVWGTVDMALPSNADTFHHTNACPQPQYTFNAASSVWAGIEQYVLLNADAQDERVSVITGPVFQADDPVYHDEDVGEVRIPMTFFKIVVRVEAGKLESLAMIARVPAEVQAALFAGQAERAESVRADNWKWPADLSLGFKTTVAHIAELTGLDFGNLGTDGFNGAEGLTRTPTPVADLGDLLPKRRPAGAGFGKFDSIEDFLAAYEASLIAPAAESLQAEPES